MQLDLLRQRACSPSLPQDYEPIRPAYFEPSQIYLTKGSTATPERRRFVERICALYPEARIAERLDTTHNRLELDSKEPLSLHRTGKHTLVFGELASAVRFASEKGNACPNYWHFSPYGFCPYGCRYCYLAGTPGVKFSPTVKIYVNLPEILQQIDNIAQRLATPTAFYLGKLQDSLALDSLTAYSTVMVPFFAEHPWARLTMLTKSAYVNRLLNLEHRGHSFLSWSVNPPEVQATFEENTPSIEERLQAMRHVAECGYPVRAIMMPIIPIDGWQEVYSTFTKRLLETVNIQRLTLGGICIYGSARDLMERKMGTRNVISEHIDSTTPKADDGRERYPQSLRHEVYALIIQVARRLRPNLDIALCLEEQALWESTGLAGNMGRCNCHL
ncbi:MAG: radical SAM protein [Dehalococcoidales bacterium]|nr:radical SAM protein [Dehalococcoidales bacterium]